MAREHSGPAALVRIATLVWGLAVSGALQPAVGAGLAAGDPAQGRAPVTAQAEAFAKEAAPAKEASPERALFLEVVLNGTARQMVCRFRQLPDGELGAEAAELRDVGLHAPAGSAFVRLNSLKGVSYRVDDATQRVLITAPLDQLALQSIDLGPMRGPIASEPFAQSYGLLANYDLYAATSSPLRRAALNYEGASASIETRALTPYGTFKQTAIVGNTTLRRDVTALRLDTTFTHVDTETERIFRAGDVISGGLAWSRPVRLGGLQVERNFGLRPDLVTLPLPSASGTAAVPSSLDVFVNGVQTYSQSVAAGPYQVNNIPAVTGAGNARIVLRDASGQEVQQNLPFFASARLLRAGLYDYSVEAGFARLNYAVGDFDYSRTPGIVGSGRYGLTDWLTLETHVEASRQLGLGGAGLNVRTGSFGVLSGAAAASASADGQGLLAYASYQTQAFGLSLQLDSQRTFGRYRDLAAVTARQLATTGSASALRSSVGYGTFSFGSVLPPIAIDRISVGLPLNRWASSLNASFTNYVTADAVRSRIASLSYSLQLPANGSLFASAFGDIEKRRNAGVVAGISFPIGHGITTSAQGSTGQGSNRALLQASKSLGTDVDSFGWNINESEGEGAVRSATLDYRSRYGQVGGGVTQIGQSAAGTGHYSGAVVAMPGGGVHFGPRIDDSFAIVRAGAPNVPVEVENKLVGVTDRNGELLLPGLRSTIQNKITIDATKLPVNATVGQTKTMMTPLNGGGAVIDFAVDTKATFVQVKFVDRTGKDIPPGSQGHAGETTFVVGYDGAAFLPGVGRHEEVRIELEGADCKATLALDPAQTIQLVGPVPCV